MRPPSRGGIGDDTAWRLGRVSFNPVKHIDPFGTVLLPGMLLLFHAPFLFGYAKPVPVNFRALYSPRRDMVLVAAAGPVHSALVPWKIADNMKCKSRDQGECDVHEEMGDKAMCGFMKGDGDDCWDRPGRHKIYGVADHDLGTLFSILWRSP
jgi:hypothetical protein